ncbi:MAG: riboflavin biosynthesis protein RibF [Sarcina sp.]|jgi:riboflavin kinase/FMN adenylyltransferase|uniref:riboflavin biosynthesis protein RibF n=1 Tax=Sarcina sp. DSM 11001 TaxID=1798184 RepID=UPI0008901995|nr:riboflavin biosynthesis protein RibF [Sarcina sp. DSM 11001]MBE6001783.1 riboflavin biosynthesis protein RibF [Sarcina sp.]SDL04313.1 riboflavin kinase / FMN adenylyltransferase [Sarcina sp. DSM 11001]HAL59836.1 riboflavin biosynthesis protein RibF [Sarcina sp.]
MQIIRDTTDFVSPGETAVSIGKFDGVHLGHRRLLEELIDQKEKGLLATVFTFDPYPEVFFGYGSKQMLTTLEEKEQIFEKMGIDILVEFPFNAVSAATPSREFVTRFLCSHLRARFIAAGPDLSFGDHGSGNFSLLEELAPEYGFTAKKIEKVIMDENIISSTLIRRLISTGEVTTAARYLGEPYMVRGRIVHGKALGRRIGIPTLNQVPPEDKLLPPFGVYYSDVLIGEKKYCGMTNIGIKPTVSEEKRVTVETYLYDFRDDIYGETATVQLLTHRRPEMKFGSLEELKKTMEQDIQAGRVYHGI